MSDLPEGRNSTSPKHRGNPGANRERAGAIVLALISLLLLSGGVASLVQIVTQQQDAAGLAAAPVCAPEQRYPESAGCKLEERVTVTDLYTEEAGRSGYVTQNVKVQTPDGSTYSVYSSNNDFGLWSRLRINEQVNAEIWQGKLLRLDDSQGHYLLAGDQPAQSYFAGGLLLTLGVLAAGLFVRRYILRPRAWYASH